MSRVTRRRARGVPRVVSPPAGLLPTGHSLDVFVRVLDMVHAFNAEPGLFVILHLPSTSGLRVDNKHIDLGISVAWKAGRYNVLRHRFPKALVRSTPAGPRAPAAGLRATRCIILLDKDRLVDNIRLLNKSPEEYLFKTPG